MAKPTRRGGRLVIRHTGRERRQPSLPDVVRIGTEIVFTDSPRTSRPVVTEVTPAGQRR